MQLASPAHPLPQPETLCAQHVRGLIVLMCQRWIKVRGSRSSARLHTVAHTPPHRRCVSVEVTDRVNGRSRDTGRSKAPVKWDVGNQIFQRDALSESRVGFSAHETNKAGAPTLRLLTRTASHSLQKLSCFPHWGLVPNTVFHIVHLLGNSDHNCFCLKSEEKYGGKKRV